MIDDDEHRTNFIMWFKEPLGLLYKEKGAGFAVLMISLPLLERYLRKKTAIHEGKLCVHFYDAVLAMFPTLGDQKASQRLWDIYRNGLLHQASLKSKDQSVSVKNDAPDPVSVSSDGKTFVVSPEKFSRKVIEQIEDDFETYLKPSPSHPLETLGVEGYSGYQGWVKAPKS